MWENAKMNNTAPRLTDAELSRKLDPLKAKSKMFTVFAAICFGITVLSIVLEHFTDPSLLLILSPIIGTILCCACLHMMSKYTKKKKRLISANVVHDMLASAFELSIYDPDRHVGEYWVQKSQLKGWDNMQGSDFIRAKYRGIDFTFSDVTLTAKRGKYTATIFSGQWLIVDMGKTIGVPVVVSELARKDILRDTRSKVQMENVAFSRQFTVLTEDPLIAFYVLTPHFMEFIMSSRSLAKGKKHLCFADTNAHVAINTRSDSFEPCKNVTDIPVLRGRIQDEIDFIKSVIDELLLNERLFDPKQSRNTITERI